MNGHRRDLFLWLNSMEAILNANEQYFTGKELTWIRSTNLSIQVLSREMLKGLHPTEIRALINASKCVSPVLYSDKGKKPNERVTSVPMDLIFNLAECAIDVCKYDCDMNFDTCPRRELFLDLYIEPWTTDGPCQFYRGGDLTEVHKDE
jgi:hypothetical protein